MQNKKSNIYETKARKNPRAYSFAMHLDIKDQIISLKKVKVKIKVEVEVKMNRN